MINWGSRHRYGTYRASKEHRPKVPIYALRPVKDSYTGASKFNVSVLYRYMEL